MSDKNYIEEMRISLAIVLPKATEHAMRSYQQFANQNLFHDAKNFSVHHTACKAALAHVDYLTKLAQWLVKQTAGKDAADDNLSQLIQHAREQLLQAQQNYE